jgi:hypothetical protein
VQNLQQIVERFIAGAAQPAGFDPAEEPLAVVSVQWNFSTWNGRDARSHCGIQRDHIPENAREI